MSSNLTTLKKTAFQLLLFLSVLINASPAQSPKDFVSVDAARYSLVVSRGSIAAGFTNQVTTETAFATDTDTAVDGVQLPTQLGGVSVTVNNRLAGLLAVTPNQINYVIPAETELDSPATVVVTGSGGAVLAQGTINVATSMLSIFTANQSGGGAPAALYTPDGVTYNAVANTDGSSRVVPTSNYLVLFGTGVNSARQDLKAYVGGIEAPVTYAGPQGSLAGLSQINVYLPDTFANQGQLELRLSDGSLNSNNVTLNFGSNTVASPEAPTITSVNKNNVHVGDVVTLTGTNFPASISAARVRLGIMMGEVISTSPTELSFIVPVGAETSRIAVRNAAGERESNVTLNVVTSISGQVLGANDEAMAGLRVFVNGSTVSSTTDSNGRFVLENVPAGIRQISVDTGSLPFISESLSMVVTQGRDNELASPISLLPDSGTALDVQGAPAEAESSAVDPATGKVVENQGLRLEIPGVITFPDGTEKGRLKLFRLPSTARLTTVLPAGVYPSVAAFISPLGTTFGTKDGKDLATLSFPNPDNFPAGTTLDLYAYNRNITPSAFEKKGQAVVNANGDRIVAASLIDVATVWFVGLPADKAPITKVKGVIKSKDQIASARVFVRGRSAKADANGSFIVEGVRAKNGEELTVEVLAMTSAGFPLKAVKKVTAVVPGETDAGEIELPEAPALLLMIQPQAVRVGTGTSASLKVVLSRKLEAEAVVNLTKAEGADKVTLSSQSVRIEAGKIEAEFRVTGVSPGTAVVTASLAAAVGAVTPEKSRGARAVVHVLSPAPVLTGLRPESGAPGDAFSIAGTGFSKESKYNLIFFKQGELVVPANPLTVRAVSGASNDVTLTGAVPGLRAGAAEIFVVVINEGGASVESNKLPFTVTAPTAPVLTSITPNKGKPGVKFVLAGSGFDPEVKRNGVFFKQGERLFPVDPSLMSVGKSVDAAGKTVLSLAGVVPRMPVGAAEVFVVSFRENFIAPASNKLEFTVEGNAVPELKTITPGEGAPGTRFTITGTNLLQDGARVSVAFRLGDRAFLIEPSALENTPNGLTGAVPQLPAGDYKVVVNMSFMNQAQIITSNALAFKVVAPATK